MRLDCGPCVVRDWARSDKPSLLRYANNRNIWRNLMHRFPHPYTDARSDAWFALLEGMPEPAHEGVYQRTAQFGYWLGAPYWGHGIMTATVKAVVPYAMERFRLVRLESPVFEWNPREAVLRASVSKDGELIDSVLYAFVDTTLR